MPNFAEALIASVKCELFGYTAIRLAKRTKGCVLMFSNIRHQLGKKVKRAVALLATVTLLCSFTGCVGDEESSTDPNSTDGGLQSTPVAEPKDSQGSEVNSGNTSSSDTQNEQGSGQSEFDFDEAVKKIIIFQHEFSLPCEIKDLGNNFSLDEHPNWVVLGNVISSNLYYMNKKIGTVNISESGDKEQIICLDLGFGLGNETITDEALRKSMYDSYGWYSEEIEIDFNELDFNSSANEIRRCLGVPTEKTDAYFKDFLVYEYPNGYVRVKFFQGMITEFVIGLL